MSDPKKIQWLQVLGVSEATLALLNAVPQADDAENPLPPAKPRKDLPPAKAPQSKADESDPEPAVPEKLVDDDRQKELNRELSTAPTVQRQRAKDVDEDIKQLNQANKEQQDFNNSLRQLEKHKADVEDPVVHGKPLSKALEVLLLDVRRTDKALRNALRARDDMEAARKAAPRASPEDLAKEMKPTASKLSPEVRQQLQQAFEQIHSERAYANKLLDDIASAGDDLDAAFEKLENLPPAVRVLTDEEIEAAKRIDDEWELREHVWDAINVLTSLEAPVAAVLHGVAGLDFIKDLIKDSSAQLELVESHVKDDEETLNKVIGALEKNEKINVETAKRKMERAILDYKDHLKNMRDTFEDAHKAVDKYVKASGPAQSKTGQPGPNLRLYFTLEKASQAASAARHVLITETLDKDKYKAYYDQLVPLGTPTASLNVNISLHDGAQKSSHGSIYQRGRKYRNYPLSRQEMEMISQALQRVGDFNEWAGKIDELYEPWKAAFKGALR
jgi:hypothetical protein